MPVRFLSDHYGTAGGVVTTAYMGDTSLGHYVRDGNACSVRWYHLESPRPGWIESFPSVDAARAAFEAFAAGLEIHPWDETGYPDTLAPPATTQDAVCRSSLVSIPG